MNKYLENFKVKDKTFFNNVFHAPLAGYTDFPFRQMSSKFKPGLSFCEMVKMEALIRHDTNSYKILDYDKSMHPLGAQLCGSNPKIAKKAAHILEDLGFDWIDLNCGCPVDKVVKDGSGSAMLKTPELIGEMLNELVSAVNVPVSVKIRAGWDNDSINAVDIVEIAEKAGAEVIFVHGRTRSQVYRGKSDLDIIRQCKEKASSIKVFGNGDLFDPTSVKEMFDYTNCDGVLLARGMIGQPWLVRSIKQYYETGSFTTDVLEVKEEMLHHFDLISKYQIEKKMLLDMRRIGCWYLQRCEGAKKIRVAINTAKSSNEVLEIIRNFNWENLKYKVREI